MSSTERYAFALLVVVVDWVLFALPITGIAAAYILIARPPAFRAWIDKLYSS